MLYRTAETGNRKEMDTTKETSFQAIPENSKRCSWGDRGVSRQTVPEAATYQQPATHDTTQGTDVYVGSLAASFNE